MRILVTGSRDWVDKGAIFTALVEAAKQNPDITLVHGGARGADEIAARWAQHFGWTVEEHPANWEDCGDNCGPEHYRYSYSRPEGYCPRSGYKRNALMVKLGADVCLAFIRNGSNGSGMTARMAEKAGIPTHRYIQDD